RTGEARTSRPRRGARARRRSRPAAAAKRRPRAERVAPPCLLSLVPGSLRLEALEAGAQAVAPVWKTRRVVPLASQHRVRGTRRRPPQLLRGHAPHAAAHSRLLEDRLRELGPGALALRRYVPDPRRTLHDLPQRLRQVPDVGRRRALA